MPGSTVEYGDTLETVLRPYRVPTLILCVGITISIIGFITMLNRNMADTERDFLAYAELKERALREQVETSWMGMRLARRFFNASEQVTETEMHTFVQPLLQEGQYAAIAWGAVRADGVPASLHQYFSDSRHVTTEALRKIMASTQLLEAARKARSLEKVVLAEDIDPIMQTGGLRSLVMVASLAQPAGGEGGILFGVLNLDGFFAELLSHQDSLFYLYDITDPGVMRPIYTSDEQLDAAASENEAAIKQKFESLAHHASFLHRARMEVAGRKWELVFIPTAQYMAKVSNSLPWIMLITGIVVTSLISLFVFYITTRNITVSRQVAERTQELELAVRRLSYINAELERFAYVASHDLQEPLRLVSSFTEILKDDYGERLDGQAHEYMDILITEAKRMQELVTGLLTYARSEDTLDSPPEKVDCNQVLDRVLRDLSKRIRECNATITHDSLPQVEGRTLLLVQLFENLVGNALKYRREDEGVHIHIGAELQQGAWRFYVKDNGIGIREAHYQRIFEPFKRLHHRDQYPGSGIGLAICKKAAEFMGGRIWVESVPEKGSVFYFTIPA